MTHEQIKDEMKAAAYEASDVWFKEYLDGEDRGCCGFAWVTLWPEHKGNTKLGKAERREFEALAQVRIGQARHG